MLRWAAQAKRLVTGDDDLLVLGTIEFVSIVSPRAALDELNALETEFGIQIDKKNAMDLYNMTLKEAVVRIKRITQEQNKDTYD